MTAVAVVIVAMVTVALAGMLALDQARVNAVRRLDRLEREVRDARIGVDGEDRGSLNSRISYNVERERELRKLVFAIDKRLADAMNNGDVALGEINSRIAALDRQRVNDNAATAVRANEHLLDLLDHIGLVADKLGVEFFNEPIKRDQVVGSKLVLRKKPRTRK